MQNIGHRLRSGLILTELVVTMVISLVLVSAIGALLASGNRTWQRTYNSAHKKIKQDAQAVTIAFGSMGRKANRLGYVIYNTNGDTFTPAVPRTLEPQEVVSGDAVEFRFWDVEFDETDSHELMDVTKIATAYALFYLDDNQLKVDYGPYPPGAAPDGGGSRKTAGVITKVLANNVSIDKDSNVGAFSHTTLNGVGQGSVRINITLTDPKDNDSIKVMTATLIRNIWPR